MSWPSTTARKWRLFEGPVTENVTDAGRRCCDISLRIPSETGASDSTKGTAPSLRYLSRRLSMSRHALKTAQNA